MAIFLVALRYLMLITLCVLLADFISGFVHWLEDGYGQPSWPLIGQTIIEPNLLHHREPRAMVANTWWQSADLQFIGGTVALSLAALCGWLSWELTLLVALTVNTNEVHKWAHRTKRENGRFITWMQAAHVVQSRAHHGRHHGGNRNTHFCALTPWLNPLLERVRFWRGLEALIRVTTGVSPRLDPVVTARAAAR